MQDLFCPRYIQFLDSKLQKCVCNLNPLQFIVAKGQIKTKAVWACHAVDSPKKQTNEFVLFAVKSKKANKTNLFLRFLGKSTACQSVFGFI